MVEEDEEKTYFYRFEEWSSFSSSDHVGSRGGGNKHLVLKIARCFGVSFQTSPQDLIGLFRFWDSQMWVM